MCCALILMRIPPLSTQIGLVQAMQVRVQVS